ncbi:phosphotransferase [Cellulomonas fimi]|uniref:phosphotransferase n=1 Tax=Cellulomonas fimi TaxID=1708 RepID=UPI002359B19B|nr:phosphotransferase [Cellulomonas fimi]
MNRLESWATPDTSAVTALARRAGLGENATVTRLEGGLVTTNFRVSDGTRDVVVRVYPPSRDPDEVTFELSVLQHLRAADVPVPGPLPSDAPVRATWDGRQVAVLEYLPGRTVRPDELSTSVAAQAGALYAQMQDALRDARPVGTKGATDGAALDELVAQTHAALVPQDADAAESLRHAWDHARRGLAQRAPSGTAVVHGDFWCANVLAEDTPSGPVLTGVIDFDDCYVGDLGLDLALAATEFAYDEQDHLHGDRLDAFLAGYSRTSRRPVATDTDTFLLWMTAVFCKFACYTLPLAEPPIDGPVQNPYLTRLRAVGAPRVREAVENAVTGAEAVHA